MQVRRAGAVQHEGSSGQETATCPGSERRSEREAPCSILRASIALDDREEALQLATGLPGFGAREGGVRRGACAAARRIVLI